MAIQSTGDIHNCSLVRECLALSQRNLPGTKSNNRQIVGDRFSVAFEKPILDFDEEGHQNSEGHTGNEDLSPVYEGEWLDSE